MATVATVATMATKKTIRYTRDELNKFNVYELKTIPTNKRYDVLRQHVRVNLVDVVNRPVVPKYIEDIFGKLTPKYNHSGLRTPHEPLVRPRIGIANQCQIDVVVEQIRDILNKISRENRDILLKSIQDMEIIDESGLQINQHIYNFAIEVPMQLVNYVKIIHLLKTKNPNTYQQLIQVIIDRFYKPMEFDEIPINLDKNRKWRVGNTNLIGELYVQLDNAVSWKTLKQMLIHTYSLISITHPEHIEIICGLLKIIYPKIKNIKDPFIDDFLDKLESITDNREYPRKDRELIGQILDLYHSE